MESMQKSSDFIRERDAHAREDKLRGDESSDLVVVAEAGVLRVESVTGLARWRENGDDDVIPLNTSAKPGGVSAALSLLLHRRPPLPRVLLQPILRRISQDLPRRRRRETILKTRPVH
ncbi:hypothetical protein Acr_17g0013410 [Actinidia rufa]|uniref:Uncharacterized protein n=1 Tax=Actinidia rufa TaxID=165716 RepID=A0A7J0G4R2_9ERIC|nr:hypothetical protein Acr_17g0013410 [Actinidia rufa]